MCGGAPLSAASTADDSDSAKRIDLEPDVRTLQQQRVVQER